MAHEQPNSGPIGPDEGQYDVRKGATAYSSIVASIGSLAVAAIAVIFTADSSGSRSSIVLATGLLAIAFMGSIVGAFAFAAIGAERDPTANIAKAVLFASVPVSMAIISTFGAFEALASIYVRQSVQLFAAMTGVAGLFCIIFTASSIPDSIGLHPTKMSAEEYSEWRERRWLKTRTQALSVMRIVMLVCGIPILVAVGVRLVFGGVLTLGNTGANWVVLLGAGFLLVGSFKSFVTHPKTGNDQVDLKALGAWLPNVLIAAFTCVLVLTLP